VGWARRIASIELSERGLARSRFLLLQRRILFIVCRLSETKMDDRNFASTGSHIGRVLRNSVLRCAAAAALVGVGSLGAGAAFAANAQFTVVVNPVPLSVSVGRSGLTTYAAYEVSITNTSGNTTNAIQFGGSTNVTGDLTASAGDAGAVATFIETLQNDACTGGGTSFQCNFAQMQNGANQSFVVIFAVPALADASTWATGAAINLTWTLDYASGNSSGTPTSLICNGQPAAPPPCIATVSTGLTTTLDGQILSDLTSYIPSFGGIFFTGDGLSARPTSLPATSVTKLTIPAGLELTTAQVKQLVTVGGFTSATTTTNRTYITVPSGSLFSDFATIELRRDASTIAKGAKIANAAVLYSHDAEVTNQIDPTDTLPACPTGGVPTASAPVCVFDRIEFTKKNAPTADDVGDWLFIIHALENGGFKF
jgi:hypothetical protein